MTKKTKPEPTAEQMAAVEPVPAGRPDELGRCPAERRPAPTVPGTFPIMVGAADVLGLKPITLDVALRDTPARQLRT